MVPICDEMNEAGNVENRLCLLMLRMGMRKENHRKKTKKTVVTTHDEKNEDGNNVEESVMPIVHYGNEEGESQEKTKNTVVTRNETRRKEIEKQVKKKATKVNAKAITIQANKHDKKMLIKECLYNIKILSNFMSRKLQDLPLALARYLRTSLQENIKITCLGKILM